MIDVRPLVFAAVAALLAAPAFAQDVDGVIATGSNVPAPMTTDQKIANILAAARKDDEAQKAVEAEPRKIHGAAEVSVGSDGYRSVYLQTVIPVGETGTVAVAYSQSQGGRGYGYGYGPGYDGIGLGGPGGPGRHGYGRGGSNRQLGLAFDLDASRSTSDSGCAEAFRDGRQPVEPLWATEIRGRSACETPRKD